MRRYLAVVALFCAFALTGIGHRPRGTPAPPTPSPTPVASPTPAIPVVMIYPFAVNGDADKNAGNKMAGLLLGELQSAGGIIVRPIPTAPVARTDYLTDSIKNGADYYLSGYMTPLGDEVALVEQVVSTSSGAIIWANTAQVLTYGDAISQADIIRKIVLGHAGRVEAEYRQQQALATPTPGPANGTQTSIGAILGLLHHSKATPAPKPSLAPDQKPLRAMLVFGHDTAAAALQRALDRAYRVSNAGAASQNIAADIKRVCTTFSNVTLAAGDTRKETSRGFPRTTTNVFTLHVYRCDGSVFFTSTARSASLDEAIEQTVAAYVAAHPSNT